MFGDVTYNIRYRGQRNIRKLGKEDIRGGFLFFDCLKSYQTCTWINQNNINYVANRTESIVIDRFISNVILTYIRLFGIFVFLSVDLFSYVLYIICPRRF